MKEKQLRTGDLKKIVEAFELERDKLLDQVQYLKGSAERLEWVIKVMNGQLDKIDKEEDYKAALALQQQKALDAARARGNVGTHPASSERRADLEQRRQTKDSTKEEQAESSNSAGSRKKTKKKASTKEESN